MTTLKPRGPGKKRRPELVITVKEAAKRLGIGVDRAYAAVQKGQIPSIPIGGRRVVPIAALNRMLEG